MSPLQQEAAQKVAQQSQIEPTRRVMWLHDYAASLETETLWAEIKQDWVHVYWGGDDYPVSLESIHSPLKLIGLVQHLTEKEWPLLSPRQIGMFIETICKAKSWDQYA